MGNLLPLTSSFGTLELTGKDAFDFGQRMFSRNLQFLEIGLAKLGLFLTAEGRISEIFWICRPERDSLLLLARTDRLQPLEELIKRYHFAESFKVTRSGPNP